MQVHLRAVLVLELDVSPYGVGEICHLKAHYLGDAVEQQLLSVQFSYDQ